jgi:hypothetical protein
MCAAGKGWDAPGSGVGLPRKIRCPSSEGEADDGGGVSSNASPPSRTSSQDLLDEREEEIASFVFLDDRPAADTMGERPLPLPRPVDTSRDSVTESVDAPSGVVGLYCTVVEGRDLRETGIKVW